MLLGAGDLSVLSEAFFIAGALLVGLSFFVLRGIFRKAQEIRRRRTHFELLFAAIPLIAVWPVFEAYSFTVSRAPLSGVFNLFAMLFFFSGTLALFFVVNKLRSLELAYLAPTLAYLGVNLFFVASVSNAVDAVAALFYVEAFWFFSLGILGVARFTDEFSFVNRAAPFLKILSVLLLGVPTLVTIASLEYVAGSGAGSAFLLQARFVAGALFLGCAFALFSILFRFNSRLASCSCSVGAQHLSARDLALAKKKPVE